MKNKGIPFAPEVGAGWEKDPPMTDETMRAMALLMTNLGRPVFAFMGDVPPEVTTALFARYSRSPRPLRSLLVREFWGEAGLDLDKARELASRVVQEYGDDSVKQLGTVNVGCEMVSQLAVKEMEDTRLGGFLEKSSRYVDFGKQVNGKYLYLRPLEICQTELAGQYEQVMDEAFELYKLAVAKLIVYLENKFPRKVGVDDKVYKASIRAKAFDIGRVFLPMATLTNVGLVLSAQSVENMANKMKASPLLESRLLGVEIQDEVNQVLPALVVSAEDDKHARAYIEYLQTSRTETDKATWKALQKLTGEKETDRGQSIDLVWKDERALRKVVAGILYPKTAKSLRDIEALVETMKEPEMKSIINGYVAGRTDRRHKPGRAFELASYTFEICSKVAEWRDLQRHRMLTPNRQTFTMDHGFATPEEFGQIEIDGEPLSSIYEKHMAKRQGLFEAVRTKISPEAAQHVVGFGNYMRWMITINLRELYHMIPLRAGSAGHPDYRRIAREMFYKLAEVDPILAMPMEVYIDFSDEPRLDRLDQLTKVREKMNKLGGGASDTFGE